MEFKIKLFGKGYNYETSLSVVASSEARVHMQKWLRYVLRVAPSQGSLRLEVDCPEIKKKDIKLVEYASYKEARKEVYDYLDGAVKVFL